MTVDQDTSGVYVSIGTFWQISFKYSLTQNLGLNFMNEL